MKQHAVAFTQFMVMAAFRTTIAARRTQPSFLTASTSRDVAGWWRFVGRGNGSRTTAAVSDGSSGAVQPSDLFHMIHRRTATCRLGEKVKFLFVIIADGHQSLIHVLP